MEKYSPYGDWESQKNKYLEIGNQAIFLNEYEDELFGRHVIEIVTPEGTEAEVNVDQLLNILGNPGLNVENFVFGTTPFGILDSNIVWYNGYRVVFRNKWSFISNDSGKTFVVDNQVIDGDQLRLALIQSTTTSNILTTEEIISFFKSIDLSQDPYADYYPYLSIYNGTRYLPYGDRIPVYTSYVELFEPSAMEGVGRFTSLINTKYVELNISKLFSLFGFENIEDFIAKQGWWHKYRTREENGVTIYYIPRSEDDEVLRISLTTNENSEVTFVDLYGRTVKLGDGIRDENGELIGPGIRYDDFGRIITSSFSINEELIQQENQEVIAEQIQRENFHKQFDCLTAPTALILFSSLLMFLSVRINNDLKRFNK